MRSRNEVVKLITSWIGKNERDGSYKYIVDIYNSFYGPFPRGIKMQYNWPWCACTWSAVAIKLGYTDIMPIEISCGELIKKAKNMGIWEERDGYIPDPGDGILYAWDDNGMGDNHDAPDHIGIVTYVNENSGYMIVTEGNYNNAVKMRTVDIDGLFIRGFISPKYDNDTVESPKKEGKDIDTLAREVIAGIWGSGSDRKENLTKMGYNYEDIQKRVNKILSPSNKKPSNVVSEKTVQCTCYAKSADAELAGVYTTAANLNCRNGAGTNKRSLCIIPKGTKVRNYGLYTKVNGVKWLLVQTVVNDIQYIGFCSSEYLNR